MATCTRRIVSERTVEYAFRVSFDVDKMPDNNVMLDYEPATEFDFLGCTWKGDVRHNDGNQLDVYLDHVGGRHPDDDLEDDVTFDIRLICGDRVFERKPDLTELDERHRENVISWDQLIAKFCTDGSFVIEYYFVMVDPEETQVPSLISAIFTDVKVACKTSKKMVDCNKCIICRESEAMFTAFSNPKSEESTENKFTIRHECATPENTRFFIQCMYEGWIADVMDDHAEELLVLADCYECDRIAKWAVDSIRRQLDEDSFWSTVAVAVLLEEQQPSLLKCCAKFADEFGDDMHDFVNRDDRGSNNDVAVVLVAVSALHKKI